MHMGDSCYYTTVAPLKYLLIISLFRLFGGFFNRDNLIIKYFVSLLINKSWEMLHVTLHLTRSSRLWTFQLLRFEIFQVRLQKNSHFNRFYRDTQRRAFRPLEDKIPCELNTFR
jgi:hypothetical protein